jgi:5-methylcytosine-specific restriction enzyme A
VTGRAVKEWIGKTPDTKIPPRVVLRVWARCGGICQITGRKIMPGDDWQADHITALINGGEHRESNLRIVLTSAHKLKTAEDVAEKAMIDRKRKAELGLGRPSGFPPPQRRGRATAPLTKTLPPRRWG